MTQEEEEASMHGFVGPDDGPEETVVSTKNEAAERLRSMIETMNPQDAPAPSVLADRFDGALVTERLNTVERMKPHLEHLQDCAYIQPVPEPWRDTPCTCPRTIGYGDHDASCPRAAVFRDFMDGWQAPACNCGLQVILDEVSRG